MHVLVCRALAVTLYAADTVSVRRQAHVYVTGTLTCTYACTVSRGDYYYVYAQLAVIPAITIRAVTLRCYFSMQWVLQQLG